MAEEHSTTQSRHLGPKADAVKQAAELLADFLPGKVMAYGAAHDIQPGIWAAMLAQYRTDRGTYDVPTALFDKGHVPRITRVLDRLIRIVSNPDIDPLGENPWMDSAGDSIAGMVMQGVAPRATDPAPEPSGYRWRADFTVRSEERVTNSRVEVKRGDASDDDYVVITGGHCPPSPFVTGPAPCPHCGSRAYAWVNSPLGVCSECPDERKADKAKAYGRMDTDHQPAPHPRDTRIWNEGPVHPEEGL